MVNLNTTLLDQLVFAFPEKDEQEQIAQRMREVDSAIQIEIANISKLELLRSGLIADLLTDSGRLSNGTHIATTQAN